jgi:hypothetical protein
MLLTDPAVRAAHARRDLNAGLRYAVVRLAELLDPDTPFALSGCAYCDPPAAAAAFESAATDYLANPGVRFGTVLAASQLLTDALEQERNLRAWYPGDVTRLLLFAGRLRQVPAVKTLGERQVKVPYHERTTWVRQKLTALVDGSLARFRAAIDEPGTGYRDRLLDQLACRLASAPADERGWAELEHDLCYTAALLLGEGRDGRELARAVARRVAAADAGCAACAVGDVAAAPPSAYEVALVLHGVGSLEPESAAAFGVAALDGAPPRWAAGWVEARAAAGQATPLLVAVQAWDREHARVRALLSAQALQDHLVVEHPGARLSLAPEALVQDVAARTARSAGAAPRPLRRGRVTRSDGAAELRPFLRANALARSEVSPALRVLHTWIALECLSRDGGGAEHGERPALSLKLESYLPPHLAGVAAIAGLRATLVASWDAARTLALRSDRRSEWIELERRLGVAGGRPRSLRRLLEAFGDADEGELARLLADVGPFPARRLADVGRRYARGSRLAKLAEAIQVRTLIAVARLKLARHLAVHRGFDAAHATGPLAHSAVLVLDSAFEVLRLWMRPEGRPAEALAEARGWHERNLAAWRSTHELELDADHLLHPEKQ